MSKNGYYRWLLYDTNIQGVVLFAKTQKELIRVMMSRHSSDYAVEFLEIR